MKFLVLFLLAATCAMVHLADSSSTTITPLRFFLRNIFKKKPISQEIMESGIVEPTDIEEELKKAFGSSNKIISSSKPLNLGDFLSPMTRNEDDDDSETKKKPKGLLSALFFPKRKDEKKETNDELLDRLPILRNALRAIRLSGQQTLRSIIKAILPALFSN
uniref:Uncharacterized protein n=1 Tax=Strigamia maritima TaxID=126957 RepID=T1IM98_STRMM